VSAARYCTRPNYAVAVTRPSDNKLRWQWHPDAFGVGAPNENPQSLGAFKYNLRFPGQVYDSETGLYYNYFRDYDSVTGRYLESDPIGLTSNANTYTYAINHPTEVGDPRGLAPVVQSNGNIRPGSGDQDMQCSDQFAFLNDGGCRTQCCINHDKCYLEYKCNRSSWLLNIALGGIGSFVFSNITPCVGCNTTVVICLAASVAGNCQTGGCKK